MTGLEIVKEWERRQETGKYESYNQSITDMAKMIDEALNPKPYVGDIGSNPCSEIVVESAYREEQARWREAGFDAYNCDMVDEFPRW